MKIQLTNYHRLLKAAFSDGMQEMTFTCKQNYIDQQNYITCIKALVVYRMKLEATASIIHSTCLIMTQSDTFYSYCQEFEKYKHGK